MRLHYGRSRCTRTRDCYTRAYVCEAGRAAGIAKAPGRTSINTGLSLLVWVLSGQGVSPGKQPSEPAASSVCDCLLALVRIRFALLFVSCIFDLLLLSPVLYLSPFSPVFLALSYLILKCSVSSSCGTMILRLFFPTISFQQI